MVECSSEIEIEVMQSIVSRVLCSLSLMTAVAAATLVERLGGYVTGYGFMVELSFLHGRQRLDRGKIVTLLTY